jgi:cell wall-associated NlpC family hydrolase
MSPEEKLQRDKFVAAAMTYIGTPYHSEGRVRGAGVDCATLLACAAEDAGLTSSVRIPHYPPDWHLHRGSERYLAQLLKHVREIAGPPLPGDIAIWRFGRSFSHGAIVKDWPTIIHAHVGRPVSLENAEAAMWLKFIGESGPDRGALRPIKFFSYWGS